MTASDISHDAQHAKHSSRQDANCDAIDAAVAVNTTAAADIADIQSTQEKNVEAAAVENDGYAHGSRLFLIMTAVMLFIFLAALDQTIVSTAVPAVTNEFNSFSDVGWYGSAYLLTSTAFQPLFGRLYKSFDIKLIYLLALFLFEVGSLISGVAQDSPTFIVGRAISGLGLAGGNSGSRIIVNLVAPLSARPVLMSLVGAAYGVGGTIGPLIGGAFTTHTTWRWCFYINLIFYAIVGPAILVFLQMPTVKHTESVWQRLSVIDWLGSVLILSSLTCILLVLQWGGVQYDWNDSRIIGLFVGFVAITVAFLVEQYFLGDRAIIPFRIFYNRTVAFGSMVNFGVAAVYFTELYFLPIYFQSVRGSTASRSGVQMLPYIIAVVLTVTTTGSLVKRTGIYIPYLLIGTSMAALGGGVLYFLLPDSSQATWCGLLFLAGLGIGMSWMLPFIAATATLALADMAQGSAIVTFGQTLGGTIFVSVAQSVFQNKFVLNINHIPNANAQAIISKGVSGFRESTPAAQLSEVVDAANRALQPVWIMVGVLGAFSFLSVWGMELRRRIPRAEDTPQSSTPTDEESK